jgi:hypothetical protein
MLRVPHAPGYHEWPASTPIVDAIMAVIGVASVVIGGYALLFLGLAALRGNGGLVVDNGLILVGVMVLNGVADGVRHWRRHHG